MKNALIILVAVLMTAFSSFAQGVQEVSYDSLDVASQKLFSKFGVANPYGDVVKIESDSIIAIYKVNDIKKSRKMLTDSTGTHPEFTTQYMVLYVEKGETKAFVRKSYRLSYYRWCFNCDLHVANWTKTRRR